MSALSLPHGWSSEIDEKRVRIQRPARGVASHVVMRLVVEAAVVAAAALAVVQPLSGVSVMIIVIIPLLVTMFIAGLERGRGSKLHVVGRELVVTRAHEEGAVYRSVETRRTTVEADGVPVAGELVDVVVETISRSRGYATTIVTKERLVRIAETTSRARAVDFAVSLRNALELPPRASPVVVPEQIADAPGALGALVLVAMIAVPTLFVALPVFWLAHADQLGVSDGLVRAGVIGAIVIVLDRVTSALIAFAYRKAGDEHHAAVLASVTS